MIIRIHKSRLRMNASLANQSRGPRSEVVVYHLGKHSRRFY